MVLAGRCFATEPIESESSLKMAYVRNEEKGTKLQPADAHAVLTCMNEYPRLRPRRVEAAARLLPGRVRTMMHVARLSGNPRVRAVAEAWQSLTAIGKIECYIEDLCRGAGIGAGDLIGSVAGTGWEFGINVAAFCVQKPGYTVSLRTALGEALMKGQPLELCLTPTAWNRRRDRLVAEWMQRANGVAATLRRRSRLSQSQFASLFMATTRTVRRWEARLSALTTHQQFFLRLFVMYIERNGLPEFRRRFVGQAPRYGKAGRPAV